jgi:hypothetical protein
LKQYQLYPASDNEPEPVPFYHNIVPAVLKLRSHKTTQQAEQSGFSVENAYVTPYGAVVKNGFSIKQSVYKYSPEKDREIFLSFLKKKFTGRLVKVSGDCIVAHHSWYQNY